MSVPVIITLTNTGPSVTGPFSIYCLQFGILYNPPLITGITKAQLLAGYYIVSPTGCDGLRVMSNGVDCTNYIDFEVSITTSTTTSSTTTSSTTTTTTSNPDCVLIYFYNEGPALNDIFWEDCDTGIITSTTIEVGECYTQLGISGSGSGEAGILVNEDGCAVANLTVRYKVCTDDLFNEYGVFEFQLDNILANPLTLETSIGDIEALAVTDGISGSVAVPILPVTINPGQTLVSVLATITGPSVPSSSQVEFTGTDIIYNLIVYGSGAGSTWTMPNGQVVNYFSDPSVSVTFTPDPSTACITTTTTTIP